jgi:hypothetical protein
VVGYKVHLTEFCSPGSPHLITNIETTHAHTPDAAHVARCQDDLAQRNLLPRRQFVDGSYIGSQIALESQKRHNIELVGPAKQNWHRHQVESGYDLSAFKIDWNGHFAICPRAKRVRDGGLSQAILVGYQFIQSSPGPIAPNAVSTICARRTARRIPASWHYFLVKSMNCERRSKNRPHRGAVAA